MKEQIKYLKIGEITPYENNPRKNDAAVDMVAASIRDYGFRNPIIVDKDLVIIAGHTRLKAAQKLGLSEVPVIVADDLTDDQARALRLVDNKAGEFAEWDENALSKELFDLKNIDLSLFFGDAEGLSPDDFGEAFSLPSDETPQTRTITLSLNEEQYAIATRVIEYVEENDMAEHDFGNQNKKSNALFEGVYQWAAQKNLL